MKYLLFFIIIAINTTSFATPDTVLVSVGKTDILASDLHDTLSQSLLSEITELSRSDTGALTAHYLRRLVAYQLLLQEAKSLTLDDAPHRQQAIEQQYLNNRFNDYMQSLINQIQIPKTILTTIQRQWINPEAIDYAVNQYRQERLKEVHLINLHRLQLKHHLEFLAFDPSNITPNTPLAKSDSFSIHYSDLMTSQQALQQHEIKPALMLFAEKRLIEADTPQKLDDRKLAHLKMLDNLLVNNLLRQKITDWTKDKKDIKAWFKQTPALNQIPEQRLIAQLIVSTPQEAEKLRKSTLEGASFYDLATKYSLDPMGRKNKGIVGWVYQGQAFKALEEGIATLENKQVSPVIKTQLGYHLVMIIQRNAGQQRPFHQIKSIVKQQLIRHKLSEYLLTLAKKTPVHWHLFDSTDDLRDLEFIKVPI